MIVAIYLCAIVAANLLTAKYGPVVSIANSFLLIGLDMTLRDSLHEKWNHKRLVVKMTALIFAGSAISYVINAGAKHIAVASALAFAAAMIADALAYTALGKHGKMLKVNGSNVVSSAVDSIVFPLVAFGGIMPWVMIGQFSAKVGGGFAWSLVTTRRLAVAVFLMLIATTARAGDIQLHYDFDRAIETMTVEQFSPGEVTSFYFFDVDYKDGIQSIYGEAYASTGVGGAWHVDAGLNGGLHRDFPLGQWLLIGAGYGPATAYARIDKDGNVEPQITGVWNRYFGKLNIEGFADLWRENGKWIILSEPQAWWNFTPHVALGTEVEISSNFAGAEGWKISPTIGCRFKF